MSGSDVRRVEDVQAGSPRHNMQAGIPNDNGQAERADQKDQASDEAALIRLCQSGDRDAFGALVRRYQDRVYNTCWRMCGHRSDAEDLTQETFVRAFQAIERFDGRAAFYTWIFRIAVNLTLSHRRTQRRRGPHHSLDATAGNADGHAAPSFGQQLPGHEPDPHSEALATEETALVMAALDEIDPEHRAIVVLRDLESLSYDEIADILDVPVGTVKSRLHRGRLALRDRLGPILGADR